jgi:hypothetical protein
MDSLRQLFETDDEGRNALRVLGGLLLGIGFVVIWMRRSNPELFGEDWGAAALFLTLALPCLFLFGSALLAVRATGETPAWQGVYVVFGLLLLPAALALLVNWLTDPGDAGNSLNVAWIFLLAAAVAAYAAFFLRVRYALLLTAAFLVVSWLALWDELLDDGIGADIGTLRGLLVAVAAILLALAALVRFRAPGGTLRLASELVTVAGLAAVAAGAISVVALFGVGQFVEVPVRESSLFWDIALLVVSLLLIAYGVRFGVRGPTYAGAVGLVFFALIVGFDLEDTAAPDGSILGWPLALVLLGLAAIVASLIPGLRTGSLGLDRLESDEPPPPEPPAGTGPAPRAGGPLLR